MEVNLAQLRKMLGFLWLNAPRLPRMLLLPLALIAGVSRDFVLIVVNKAAAAPLEEALFWWLPLFGLAFFVVILSAFYYQILTTSVTTSVINSVRLTIIGNLLKVQPGFVNGHKHGSIYHILTTDVSAVANFTSTILGLLPSVIFLSIAIPQLFYYSAVAGFFVMLVMVGGTLSYYLQQKAMSSLNADARLLEVEYFERVSELLKGFRELRLNLGRRQSFMGDVALVLSRLRGLLIRVNRIYETGESAVHALKFLLFGGIVFLVPTLAATETATTFQVLTLVLFSLTPFEQIISSYPSFIGTLVAYFRIADLNAQLAPFAKITEEMPATVPAFKTITLKNVTAVHSAGEASNFVLGPLDMEIRHNEILFLIGHNGSGKTTFMNVLAGMHDVASGQIEVDGKVLHVEDMAAYRARVSAIFSQYHVFRVMYGLEDTGEADAQAVIEKVGLKGVTVIRNGAVTRIDLSAGQKRRLALAVALLENRDLLIFDEFVADQDPGQREFFFKTLLPELKARGKTVIVSTHDMQWVGHCDRLYTFDQGKAVSAAVPVKAELV
jgi:putative ATP-binding cassette transporter